MSRATRTLRNSLPTCMFRWVPGSSAWGTGCGACHRGTLRGEGRRGSSSAINSCTHRAPRRGLLAPAGCPGGYLVIRKSYSCGIRGRESRPHARWRVVPWDAVANLRASISSSQVCIPASGLFPELKNTRGTSEPSDRGGLPLVSDSDRDGPKEMTHARVWSADDISRGR